jgi:putative endonuclease
MVDLTTWIYIVQCSDGLYYTGTHRGENVDFRVSQHNAGHDKKAFTYKRWPVTLVWAFAFPEAMPAIAAERQLKGWSRAKKEALIRGDIAALKALSQNAQKRGRNPDASTGSA